MMEEYSVAGCGVLLYAAIKTPIYKSQLVAFLSTKLRIIFSRVPLNFFIIPL
jgi:hypothetical protein